MNKPKKFKSLISKIITQLNDIVSEINSKLKTQKSLFVHTITLKLNLSKNTLNVFLNSNPTPSSEIKLDPAYMQDILKQLNEILNKVHFFNYHIRIILLEEISSLTQLELQSKSLTLPNLAEVVKNFSNFYEKKLENENILIKKFEMNNDKYEIGFDLCLIYHNLAKFGTFDLVLYKDRLYDLNMSKNENILNALKEQMDFTLSDDSTYIFFNKLKESSISLFIFGNYTYINKDNSEENHEKEINEFIFNSITVIIKIKFILILFKF